VAARAGGVGSDELNHFVAAGIWDGAPLEAALLAEVDRLVGGDAAFLVIGDIALPKKGRHSIRVAPQYASSLGTRAMNRSARVTKTSLCRSSRATMSARHSRLASSMTMRNRNLRPRSVRRSTKS